MKDHYNNLPELSDGSELTISSISSLLHSGDGLPSSFTKELYLGGQKIVGMRFQGAADDLVKDLEPGCKVTLLREPDNAYDEWAVMALDDKGRKLGYIPRKDNRIISGLMDAGKQFYGIIPNMPQDQIVTVRKYPLQMEQRSGGVPIWIAIDLYMREFAAPGDMTVIPRHGCDGSYAVVDVVFKGNDPARIAGICALKIINGEERGLFYRSGIRERSETGETKENRSDHENRSREILDEFRQFAGQLPIVSHGIEGKKEGLLKEAYGVLLGKPLSNLIIDTMVMAKNHLPSVQDFSLQGIVESQGIFPEGQTAPEKRCRAVWELYRRMDKSDLDPAIAGMIDTHTHIVPGVDDGSADMEMSMHMLRMIVDQGCRRVFATPHSEAFDFGEEQSGRTFSWIRFLRNKAEREGIPVQIFPGCEIYTSPGCIEDNLEMLRSGQIPSMNYTRYVLAEFSTKTGSYEDARFCLTRYLEEGWIPIIAHAERYCGTFATVGNIRKLRRLGCLVQVNLYDLDEEPDSDIRQCARDLLEEELVDMTGSDAHRTDHRPPEKKKKKRYIEEHCTKEYAESVLWKNAERLLLEQGENR